MRSSGVGVRGMRTAPRSAANATAPCEARIDPAAPRRGTRPWTRPRPVQTAATRRLGRNQLDVFASHPTAALMSTPRVAGPADNRQRMGPPASSRRAGSRCQFGSIGSSPSARFRTLAIADATCGDRRKTKRPCTSIVRMRRFRRSPACLCAGLGRRAAFARPLTSCSSQ